jgi:hypothetical protein
VAEDAIPVTLRNARTSLNPFLQRMSVQRMAHLCSAAVYLCEVATEALRRRSESQNVGRKGKSERARGSQNGVSYCDNNNDLANLFTR